MKPKDYRSGRASSSKRRLTCVKQSNLNDSYAAAWNRFKGHRVGKKPQEGCANPLRFGQEEAEEGRSSREKSRRGVKKPNPLHGSKILSCSRRIHPFRRQTRTKTVEFTVKLSD